MEKKIVEIDLYRNKENIKENIDEEAYPYEDAKDDEGFRERRKRREKKRGINPLKLLSVIFGIIIFFILVIFLIIMLFNIKGVEVKGATLYSNEEIEEYILNDKYSVNSLYVFFKSKILKEEKIPFVDHYDIVLLSPSKIRIDIFEKDLFSYIISEDENYLYFDDDGNVLEISDRLIDGVLFVNGISCEGAKEGDTLPIREETLMGLLTLLKNLKKYEIEGDNFTFDEAYNIEFTVDDIKVSFGGVIENVPDKVLRLKKIMAEIEGESGILHLEDWTREQRDIIFERN